MSRRPARRLLAMMFALAAIALAPVAALPPLGVARAAAQTSYTATITTIDTSAFPEIHALVAVSDSNGLRVPGLNKATFTLLENGAAVTVAEISEEEIGLQLAVVLDSSTAFAKRDAASVTRLDHVKTSLINFAVGDGGAIAPYMKDVVDNVSSFAPEGPIIQNSAVGGEIRNALIAYQSKFQTETNLLNLTAQAIDAVIAAPARPGMRREVVIFTSGIDSAAADIVTALADRAKAEDVTFHTVLVGPTASVNLPLAENVKALAALTGGSFRYFEDPIAMNPLWDTLITQRTQYRIIYRSALTQSGQHTLQALANVNGTSVLSASESFSIAVEPPTISLVDPPSEIVRATEERGVDPSTIEPRAQAVSVKIDFPDGYPRSIVKLQLIVDNAVAAETTDGPFDSLAWDLTGYSASGAHSVQVIVFDELGLEARSEAVDVLVTVNIPPPLTTTFGPMVVGVIGIGIAGVALAALVAIVVFVRRPTIVTNIVREASGRVKEITEPFIPTPHRGAAKQKQGKAFLERIDETSPGPHPTIELIGDNLRLGRDETLAQIAINDRSVSRLHCRVTEEADGLFFIHDEGSTSGTWVNYSQVSLSGQQLRHGDVINLGRVQLRFRLRFKDTPPTPATPATPVSTPEAPPEEMPAHSTEPLEPAMQPIKVTDETTDQGVPPNKTKPITQPASDEYHTEAFTPAFDENSKPETSDE